MSNEQERKILEAAAKACKYALRFDTSPIGLRLSYVDGHRWNPLTDAGDCAEMCAELGITSSWSKTAAHCEFDGVSKWGQFENHDNSRIKAWMHTATMVAAKIGGYEE